jgi:cytochrome c-type biogenesis protein
MATQRVFGRELGSRSLLYLVFALLAGFPVLAFAIGPLTSDSFNLSGPAGPLLAFSAGVLSFISPCVLPLVPIYITHLSGASIIKGRVTADRRVTLAHAVAFVGGLSLVFIVLGASVGLLGSYFFEDNGQLLERLAGAMLVLMGVVLIPAYGRRSPMRSAILLLALTAVFFFLAEVAQLRGDRERLILLGAVIALAWLRFAGYLEMTFLSRTAQFNVGAGSRPGYGRSLLVGGAFALGWTPCVGPILGGILTLAATSSQAWTGAYLLVAYSLGFSIPFLITGLALSDVTLFLKRIQRYAPVIEVAAGLMLIGVGVLLMTGRLTGLNSYFDFAGFNNGL